MNPLADNERVYRECGRLVLKHGVMPLRVHDVGLAALNVVGFTGLRLRLLQKNGSRKTHFDRGVFRIAGRGVCRICWAPGIDSAGPRVKADW